MPIFIPFKNKKLHLQLNEQQGSKKLLLLLKMLLHQWTVLSEIFALTYLYRGLRLWNPIRRCRSAPNLVRVWLHLVGGSHVPNARSPEVFYGAVELGRDHHAPAIWPDLYIVGCRRRRSCKFWERFGYSFLSIVQMIGLLRYYSSMLIVLSINPTLAY